MFVKTLPIVLGFCTLFSFGCKDMFTSDTEESSSSFVEALSSSLSSSPANLSSGGVQSEECEFTGFALAQTNGVGSVSEDLQNDIIQNCGLNAHRDECLSAFYNLVTSDADQEEFFKKKLMNLGCWNSCPPNALTCQPGDKDDSLLNAEFPIGPEDSLDEAPSSSSTLIALSSSSSDSTTSDTTSVDTTSAAALPIIPGSGVCNELDETAKLKNSAEALHEPCSPWLYTGEVDGWSHKTYTNPIGKTCQQYCIKQYDLPAGPASAWYEVICIDCT